MRVLVCALMSALMAALVGCTVLILAIALADEPEVDFSTIGYRCTTDADCAPNLRFEGIHATCFDGKCDWNKYLTAHETYEIILIIVSLFTVSPLAGVVMMLGLVSERATRVAMFGRASARPTFAVVYGALSILPWLIYLVKVVT